MEPNYDEDLFSNVFFQFLQSEHDNLLARAQAEGWLICVPRAGSVPRYVLSQDLLLAHILIPHDELPESHFRTLKNKEVKIHNRVINVEQDENERPLTTHILFEETFYNESLLKYKVLCVEQPLESQIEYEPETTTNILNVHTLRDCIDLLWTESGSRYVLEQLDQSISVWLTNNKNLELQLLQKQRDQAANLYSKCLQFALKDGRLKEKSTHNHVFLENIKISVETYVLHGIYKKIINGISACTAYDDACLNKIIRNLSDVQLRDLDVDTSFYESIPSAKQQMSRIDQFSTVLGKMACLKRAIITLATKSVDELLPALVFLIIKTNIANWYAHLNFLKLFRFSASSNEHGSHQMYLITSLEAALNHLSSGALLGPSSTEADIALERSMSGITDALGILDLKTTSKGISELFKLVRAGDEESLVQLLEPRSPYSTSVAADLVPSSALCHPLCVCPRCERLVSQALCDTSPTVFSCDDRGVTALHIASLTGRPRIVDFLLARGATVHATDCAGATPLHYAASRGHQNALLLLLHAGADPTSLDSDRNSALHLSAANGHEGCIKALLYYSEHVGIHLNINSGNIHGDSPLHHASRWGYENIVEILLEYGANPQCTNLRKLTPIDLAHNLYISRLLTNNKSNNNNCCTSHMQIKTYDLDDNNESVSSDSTWSFCGQRPINSEQMKRVEKLLRAVALGDSPLAYFYLGIDGPSTSNSHEVSSCRCHPLCACSRCAPRQKNKNENSNDTTTKVSATTSLNVSVDSCNADGFTALHVAAMHGHLDLVSMLLDAGANVDFRTRRDGFTPLHVAVQSRRASVVRLLLRSGKCNPDVQDSKENTPLHLAACLDDPRLIEVLLKASPDLTIKNKLGRTPLEEAEMRTYLSVARLLRGRPIQLSE